MGDVIADWPRDRMLGLLTLGRRHGLSEATLLAGTGTSITTLTGTAHRASAADEHTMIRNLLASTDPGLPLAFEAGLDFHLIMVGSYGQAIRTSPDLGSAIAFALGTAQELPVSVAIGAATDGDELVLEVDDARLPDDVRTFVSIRTMVFMAMTARELLGHPLPLNRVTARAARVPYAAVLDEFCGTPVSWDAERTQVRLDVAWLSAPLPQADPEANARAVQECRRMIDRHRDRGGTTARVRALLSSQHLRQPSLGRVSAELDMSERSLRRHLADEGTSFREIVVAGQLGRAQDLLATGRPLDEVAHDLGYSEPAAFSRAFKRWTGTSPAAWRRSTPPL